MRLAPVLSLLAALLLLPPALHAAPRAHGPEAALQAWLQQWDKAFRARDLDAVMALYADNVIAYDIVPPLQYVGKAAYRKDYEEFFAQFTADPIETEFRDVHITATRDIGIVMALERISGTMKNGQKTELWLRVTSVLRKVKGRWLDTHDHVSVPVDFATGKGVLDLKP